MSDPANQSHPSAPPVVVVGVFEEPVSFTGHAGGSEFPVGGPDGHGGVTLGPNPYDLLSASLASCTTMTIQRHALRKRYPLAEVDVTVSFHHHADGGRNFFIREIALRGELNPDQRQELIAIANMCPVGEVLGLSADIHTHVDEQSCSHGVNAAADYVHDIEELPIPYIDAD